MKELVLGLALLGMLPVLTVAACTSERMQAWMLAALVIATSLGSRSGLQIWQTQGYRGTDHGLALYLSDLLCLALALGLLAGWRDRVEWLPFNVGWGALLLLLGGVSALGTSHPEYAGYALFTAFKALGMYWTVRNVLARGTSLWYLWLGLVCVGLILGATALEQSSFSYLDRIRATFEHPNTLPTYNLLFMPALWLWRLCDGRLTRTQRFWTDLSCLGMAFAVLRTGSRGGWVVFVACMAASLAFAWWRAPNREVRATTRLLMLALPVVLVLLTPMVIRRFESAPEQSGEAREEFKRAAWMQTRDYLLGVGLNHYSWAVDTLPRYVRTRYITAGEEGGSVTHHIYLLTAAELGWPGLLCLLVLLLRTLALLLRGGLDSSSVEGVLMAGLFIGCSGVLALATLEWVLRQNAAMQMAAIVAAFGVELASRIQGGRVAALRLV